jgi:hypothetical protein
MKRQTEARQRNRTVANLVEAKVSNRRGAGSAPNTIPQIRIQQHSLDRSSKRRCIARRNQETVLVVFKQIARP